MKFYIISVFILMTTPILAQRPAPDDIKTSKGNLTIQPLHHGTLTLSWDNLTLYIDPTGGSKAFEGLKNPDMVLITDIHGDHLDMETLGSLNLTKAILIVPQAVADKLSDTYKDKVVILNNHETTTQHGIEITALPMYNLPEAADSRHTKGRGNGYILKMGGKNIYISGDTADIPEMRTLKNIDVAFVCMNLPYTMSIDQAASAVLDFKPKIIYPFHYRGSDIEAFKKLVNKSDSHIEVRLKDWYIN